MAIIIRRTVAERTRMLQIFLKCIHTFFEDMTREAGDFDFNDVVLKVTVPDESGKATVTLLPPVLLRI